MLSEELEKVLLVCHELEVWKDECISPVSDGMNQKWSRQSGYLRSKGGGRIGANTADRQRTLEIFEDVGRVRKVLSRLKNGNIVAVSIGLASSRYGVKGTVAER